MKTSIQTKMSNRQAIGCLRSCLLVYGFSHLIENFDLWKDWYFAGDIDYSMFRDGISLELALCFSSTCSDLRDACYLRQNERIDDLRKRMRILARLL